MATTRVGPTKGVRILVKLPFAETKTGGGKPAGDLIRVKSGVAKLLKFQAVEAPRKEVIPLCCINATFELLKPKPVRVL